MSVVAVAEALAATVRELAGIKQAPDYPPDEINEFPFVVCYAQPGTSTITTVKGASGLPEFSSTDDFSVEWHNRPADLATNIREINTAVDDIRHALFRAWDAGDYRGVIHRVMSLRVAEYGALGWDTTETWGVRFVVSVEHRDVITGGKDRT